MTEALCPACGTDEPAPVLCQRCTTRLRAHLTTIGKLRPQLGAFLRPGSGKPGPRAGKPGSRPPANLDVLSATDVRSRIRITDDGAADPDNVRCIDAELLTMARMTIEERQFSAALADWADCLRVLNVSADWLTRHPAADEHLAVLTDLAAACVGMTRNWEHEPSVGQCHEPHMEHAGRACGGPLDWLPSTVIVRCRRCGAEQEPDGWLPRRVILRAFGIPKQTLSDWIVSGKVRATDQHVCVDDVRAMRMKARRA